MTSIGRHWFGLTLLLSSLAVGSVFFQAVTKDLAPQDVLRVFRYENLEAPDVQICLSRFGKLYVLTGRPLMIVGECIEHAYTKKFSDLRFGRALSVIALIAVAVLLASLLVLQGVPPRLAQGVAIGVALLPGLSFMVLQGGTAIFAIIGMVPALWGVHRMLQAVKENRPWKEIALAGTPVLLSLFCFPPFCFFALILGAAHLLWGQVAFRFRMLHLFKLTVAFVATVVIYFVLVKLWTLCQYGSFSGAVDLGERNFKVSPESLFRWAPFLSGVLVSRFGIWSAKAADYGLQSGLYIVAFASLALTYRKTKSLSEPLLMGAVGFLLILIVSVPFIASAMPLEQDAFRYIFSARALLVLFFGSGCYLLLNEVMPGKEKICGTVTAGLLLWLAIPTSYLRVWSSVRNASTEWIVAKEFGKELLGKLDQSSRHHVHVVRPAKPFFGENYRGEENTIALIAHPEHVAQIVNAILRDGASREAIRKITVVTSFSEAGAPLPRFQLQDGVTNYLWDFSRVSVQ